MAFILEMATGNTYPCKAPGHQNEDAADAYPSANDQLPERTELQLVLTESTPTRNASLPPGLNISELIRSIED